jgi:predicted nucleic acid-binding protein
MIVISNTSPLANLASIGQFELLRLLFNEIWIPDAVWNELNAFGKVWPGSSEVESSIWVKRFSITNQSLVTALTRDLDLGEAESIVLALEKKANLVLLDEKEGRSAAQRQGLLVLGTVGVLLAAVEHGHIQLLRPYLEALRQTAGFYLGDELFQAVLEKVGELPE